MQYRFRACLSVKNQKNLMKDSNVCIMYKYNNATCLQIESDRGMVYGIMYNICVLERSKLWSCPFF